MEKVLKITQNKVMQSNLSPITGSDNEVIGTKRAWIITTKMLLYYPRMLQKDEKTKKILLLTFCNACFN